MNKAPAAHAKFDIITTVRSPDESWDVLGGDGVLPDCGLRRRWRWIRKEEGSLTVEAEGSGRSRRRERRGHAAEVWAGLGLFWKVLPGNGLVFEVHLLGDGRGVQRHPASARDGRNHDPSQDPDGMEATGGVLGAGIAVLTNGCNLCDLSIGFWIHLGLLAANRHASRTPNNNGLPAFSAGRLVDFLDQLVIGMR